MRLRNRGTNFRLELGTEKTVTSTFNKGAPYIWFDEWGQAQFAGIGWFELRRAMISWMKRRDVNLL